MHDLLIIDDFGMMDLNIDKCRDMYEVIESKDCRKATIIISQLPVISSTNFFQDNTYTDAYLSRMTSMAYRLEFLRRDKHVEKQ